MKFICKRSDLMHGVQTVINAVSNRNTLPILSNILFETDENSLLLSTTDLEVSIKCTIPAEITDSGSTTIPAKRLFEIVRELPDKNITLSINDNHLVTLICEKSTFKLNGLPKDEYPILPKVKKDKGFELSKTTFQNMIKKIIFAVSTDETRYVLNGVLFSVEENNLLMVSTDGHRLSLYNENLEKNPNQKFNHIVPSKALQELNKILDDEGDVNIQLNDNQIIFSTSDIVLMSRVIDGQFPNYEQVIPKQSDKRIEVDAAQLLSATRRVSLMASDKSNSVKYAISQGKMLITANTPEVGEAEEEIDVDYTGDNISVAFNAKYILDVLKNIGTEKSSLELTTNLNPGLFKPVNESNNYLCVVMPMRI